MHVVPSPGSHIVRYVVVQPRQRRDCRHATIAATLHPPEKTKPAAVKNMTIAAGTRTGLNTTSTGVARIRAITVPVKVNTDKPKSVVQIAPAVKKLAMLVCPLEDGEEYRSSRL